MSATKTELVVLESGDRLTGEEFHRRYCARPDIKKAELVMGVVYVASPVRGLHGEPHGLAVLWLGTYAMRTSGVRFVIDTTVRLGPDSEVQPDVFLFRHPPAPGAGRFTDESYFEGAPSLVVEIAASSASYDLHDKKETYRRAAVPEYIVWRVLDSAIDWFRLQGGEYVRVEPNERGVIESAGFPGLRLAVAKLVAGDMAGVLAELQGQR